MSAEKGLWCAVIYTALCDASVTAAAHPDAKRWRWQADSWIRTGGRDFQTACHLAGMDPDQIRDDYVNGRIDPAWLMGRGRHTMTRHNSATIGAHDW